MIQTSFTFHDLIQKMETGFKPLKIGNKTYHSSGNHGLPNLLVRFRGFCIDQPNQT